MKSMKKLKAKIIALISFVNSQSKFYSEKPVAITLKNQRL
jgi:hypothetical protein